METLLLSVCLLLAAHGGTASKQTEGLSSYQLIVPRPIGNRHSRDLGNTPPNRVSYSISVDGTEHVVHLEKNRLLLSADFTVFSYGQDGSLVSARPDARNHCHYQGYVENVTGSSAAMSICHGVRGVLHLRNHSYGIEPLDSAPQQHLLYRLQDVTSQPRKCGTAHLGPPGPPEAHIHSRVKRAVLHQTHYVELFLVVDNERFIYMNRNQSAVREEMVQLANYVDSMFVVLNIRVVLVGLEIWSQQNQVSTEGSAGEVLGRFTQWREKELVPRHRHDSAQLILKKSFGGTAGMAFVSTVCSRSHGGGINAYTSSSLPAFSSIVAHELGHNLGMNHDDQRGCSCPAAACIMNSGATGSRNFSTCSSDDFEKMILATGGSCLLNVPTPDEAYSAPYCGNKLVDAGEDCDCGSEKECEQDPCCEFQTCKLKSGSECAYGVCCHKCQFLAGGTVCRSSTDECDLPEYCNGTSALCQADVYIQNGHPCHGQQAYCYNGKCQHYDGQCRAIFGSKAKAAPDICFKDVNSKGDRFGNCGYQNYGYRKCESRNARCGKLQCTNVQDGTVFGIAPSVITTPIGGATCYGVDFMLGSDVPDPGMVAEGTKCAEDKVCVNYECRGVELLQYDCDPQTRCHGHGVCNSLKHCHCDAGWAPPLCDITGRGGSHDSGPTWNDRDTSLRDGLLVLFLLVLPLLALGGIAFLRRAYLARLLGLGPRKRSQYQADSGAPANPSRGPPPRAQPPSVVHGNLNNRVVRDPHHVQLLPAEKVLETNRAALPPVYAMRPPPPPKKPAAAQPLVPPRPAPPPPV